MSEAPRFVAFDVHKSYVLVAALDATLQVVLSPRRVRMDESRGVGTPGAASHGPGCAGGHQ